MRGIDHVHGSHGAYLLFTGVVEGHLGVGLPFRSFRRRALVALARPLLVLMHLPGVALGMPKMVPRLGTPDV